MKTYDIVWKRKEDINGIRWEKVGVLIIKDNGKMSIKLDPLPAGSWDGWLNVCEGKKR